MATLTEVSFYTRRLIKWGLVGLVIVLLTPPIWRLTKRLYLTLRPPPPPPPTVRYGRIPKVQFPLPSQPYKPLYKLETIDGKLPILPTVGKVYLVEINRSRLGELERIKTRIRNLGFTNEPERLDNQTFKFTHPVLPATLIADIISGGFTYNYAGGQDTEVASTAPPSREQLILEAKSLLQNMNLLAKDLADGETKITYLAASPSEASSARADIFRAPKDQLQFVTTRGQESPVNMTIAFVNDRAKRLVVINYAYSKILDDDFATYPLKGINQAWTELQQGGGYIVQPAENTVIVRKAYLAYYESTAPQAFIQPVYVFEGDNGFSAYVSAIEPTYQE